MKTELLAVVLAATPASVFGADPVVVERGPHHAVWQRVTEEVTTYAKQYLVTNSYIELATGLHYWDGAQWVESKEEIEIFPGGAIARQGQHQVIFAPNIHTAGAIDLVTPDNKRFLSHVLGIAYTDAASGRSAMIAEIKPAKGQLVAANQIVYPDAFDGLRADVRYTYTRSGLEQDIILRENPPPPEEFGLDPRTARMEVYTEFLESPNPRKGVSVLKHEQHPIRRQAMIEPDLLDESLDFGIMSIGAGSAFPLNLEHDTPVPTGKSWEIREGRQLLIEKVDYPAIEVHLRRLPQSAALKGRDPRNASLKVRLPAQPTQKDPLSQPGIQMASRPLDQNGFVIDYVILSASSNFTFKGDTTYYVSGDVGLNGTSVIEGGTVIKYTNSTGTRIKFNGPIDCQTTSYRPAIFTAKDDDTVGEAIAGSSGNPTTNYYAGRTIDLGVSGATYVLHDIRLRYQTRAISLGAADVRLELSHAQITDGSIGIYSVSSGVNLTYRNVLFDNVSTALWGNSTSTNRGEHITFHRIPTFRSGGTNYLTNSLVIAVTNSVQYSGSNVETNLSDAGIFQTLGYGSHYLAATSPYRNTGTTNINSTLREDLKLRTTYPPIQVTTNITGSTIFSIQAPRDADTPDLGYHYDSIDYLIGGIVISNATLTLTNGVAVAVDAGVTNYGIRLDSGAVLFSHGAAQILNRIVRTHCVQEKPSAVITNRIPMIADTYPAPPSTTIVRLRFTDLPQLAGTYAFKQERARGTLSTLELRDSQVRGGYFHWSPSVSNALVTLTNTLWDRVNGELYEYAPGKAYAFNNLFREGVQVLLVNSGSQWIWKDNFLDKLTLYGTYTNLITEDYNGYVTNYKRLSGSGSHDQILADSPAYQQGPLGGFYLPTNSTQLIDHGSRTADQAGLYHYTTTTNQAKEATSTVDIGFHYVAISNGVPSDIDSDGTPDYIEDPNGNGLHDFRETSWQFADRDYDGQNDAQEAASGTDPNNPNSVQLVRLGHWRFDTSSFAGDDGQLPVASYLVTNIASWSSNAALIPNTTYSGLVYRDVETNGKANINLRNGTVRFWFKPSWDTAGLAAYSGVLTHHSSNVAGMHQHYFTNATSLPMVKFTDFLITYVYLNPNSPPNEVMLKWQDTDGNIRRAYWGANNIVEGTDGTSTRTNLGPLPPTGQWVRLQVPASAVDLANRTVKTMWFTLYNGLARWDYTGTLTDTNQSVLENIWLDEAYPAGVTVGADNDPPSWYWGLPWSRIIEAGGYTADASYGDWILSLTPDSTLIGFSSASNGMSSGYINAKYAWSSNQWYQVALVYSPTNIGLYINGELIATGNGRTWIAGTPNFTQYDHNGGIQSFPSEIVRAGGFSLGIDPFGNATLPGQFEELETFNYPLDPETIAREFPNFNRTDQTVDTDYDGRSDLLEELVDFTSKTDPNSVKQVRLGHFRFNDADLGGERGQLPLSSVNVTRTPSWSINSLLIQTNLNSAVVYRDVETNGWANFNCRNGAVRFWFNPNWTSTNLGGSGPGHTASLLYLGNSTNKWELKVNPQGTRLSLIVASNATSQTFFDVACGWRANFWSQLHLNYSTSSISLYINGTNVVTTNGLATFPDAVARSNGLVIGNNYAATQSANAQFEELETFNYILPTSNITNSFEIVHRIDSDLNGTVDMLEDIQLPTSAQFTAAQFVITGTIEAEQFDKGGKGVAYTNVANNPASDYRLTGMFITNCTDLGAGYCLDRTKAGDWVKYTFQVRTNGKYTMEVRSVGNVTGGVFQVEFGRANGTDGYRTAPITISQTNWYDIAQTGIDLEKGTNYFKLIMLTNASDGFVGKFNYVSFYPTLSDFITNSGMLYLTVTNAPYFARGDGNEASAETNRFAFQTAVNDLMNNPGGGVLYVPAGTYFMGKEATNNPGEGPDKSTHQNHSVYVGRPFQDTNAASNIEIRGDTNGTSILQAIDRTTTILYVRRWCCIPDTVWYTNISIRNLTFKGRPHTRFDGTNFSYDPGAFNNSNTFSSFSGGLGTLLVFDGYFMRDVNVRSCSFINPSVYGIVIGGPINMTFVSNSFVFWNGENPQGIVPGPSTNAYSASTPVGQVGIFGNSGPTMNVVVISNYFNGNPTLTVTNGNDYSSDGIVWFQGGGNWFVARNSVNTYGLEGVQLNAGPASAVGNRFKTFQKNGSTCAFNVFASGWSTLTGTNNNFADQNYTFVGNLIDGGRHAHLGLNAWSSYADAPYTVHFCGNDVRLDPPVIGGPYWWDGPGGAVAAGNVTVANISGNTLRAGGYGVYQDYVHRFAEILKNDFSGADQTSVWYRGAPGNLQDVVLLKNTLSYGNRAHVRLSLVDSSSFFLIYNTFQPALPIFDPPNAPVHIVW